MLFEYTHCKHFALVIKLKVDGLEYWTLGQDEEGVYVFTTDRFAITI